MKRRHLPIALTLLTLSSAVLTGIDSCGRDLLTDSSFDLWCGDTLCGWEIESGAVERVSTWHEADPGASLVGDPVILSQYADITQHDADCILFTLQADADPGASLTLELDFLDDGTTEASYPISAEDWQRLNYFITPPPWYDGLRLRLRKQGGERAVIAQVRAQAEHHDKCSADPIPVVGLPDGADCAAPDTCLSGSCDEVALLTSEGQAEGVSACGACASSADCDADEACGVGADNDYNSYLVCGPTGRHELGEHCAFDEECGSGLCTEGQCAECSPDQSEGCQRAGGTALFPYMRDPASGARERGEVCLSDADCASGSCTGMGPLNLCDPDGRRCTDDTDCPLESLGATCEPIGTYAGTCN